MCIPLSVCATVIFIQTKDMCMPAQQYSVFPICACVCIMVSKKGAEYISFLLRRSKKKAFFFLCCVLKNTSPIRYREINVHVLNLIVPYIRVFVSCVY